MTFDISTVFSYHLLTLLTKNMKENITENTRLVRRKFRRFSTKRTVGKYENKAALPLLVRKTIKLLYKRNRLRFSMRMYCNNAQMTPERVKKKKSRHSTSSRAVLFSSLHALTSSVHYYSTHARKTVIYCLINK